MNPADKFMIFFGLLDLFYDYLLDFGPIIHPQFFFLYMEYFDSVVRFRSVAYIGMNKVVRVKSLFILTTPS